MSRLRQWGFIFLSLVLSLILAACESDEDRQIAEAQDCLNNASPTLASANVCLAKVDGLTSEESYYIRCSARFLGQGFVGSRFADAFESLADDEDGGGGGSVSKVDIEETAREVLAEIKRRLAMELERRGEY